MEKPEEALFTLELSLVSSELKDPLKAKRSRSCLSSAWLQRGYSLVSMALIKCGVSGTVPCGYWVCLFY